MLCIMMLLQRYIDELTRPFFALHCFLEINRNRYSVRTEMIDPKGPLKPLRLASSTAARNKHSGKKKSRHAQEGVAQAGQARPPE